MKTKIEVKEKIYNINSQERIKYGYFFGKNNVLNIIGYKKQIFVKELNCWHTMQARMLSELKDGFNINNEVEQSVKFDLFMS